MLLVIDELQLYILEFFVFFLLVSGLDELFAAKATNQTLTSLSFSGF